MCRHRTPFTRSIPVHLQVFLSSTICWSLPKKPSALCKYPFECQHGQVAHQLISSSVTAGLTKPKRCERRSPPCDVFGKRGRTIQPCPEGECSLWTTSGCFVHIQAERT
ncbi:hypothetical protein RvY_00729-2 [Ramazzottius varieornatus]|uniref:Uncharacterized protein n=1 Tax=Ramazzottius varieornatus TaxID=947166 RepID=A0A1D1UDT4_RAMVA|nr:hypothetical protein RvY_00729-2 [Ramazzottius varieornatus]